MLQTVRVENVDEKKWGHLSSFHLPFLSYGLRIVKKVHFLQFYAGVSKKSKSIKAIYAYSENGIVYYAMPYCFGDIRV